MVEGQVAWYILTSASYQSMLQQGCQREDKELLPSSQFCYQGKCQCTTAITTVWSVGLSWELCCWWQLKWTLKQWRPSLRSTPGQYKLLCFWFSLRNARALYLLWLHHSYYQLWRTYSFVLSCANSIISWFLCVWIDLQYVTYHFFSEMEVYDLIEGTNY